MHDPRDEAIVRLGAQLKERTTTPKESIQQTFTQSYVVLSQNMCGKSGAKAVVFDDCHEAFIYAARLAIYDVKREAASPTYLGDLDFLDNLMDYYRDEDFQSIVDYYQQWTCFTEKLLLVLYPEPQQHFELPEID